MMVKCPMFCFSLSCVNFSVLFKRSFTLMCDLKLGSLNVNGAREDVTRASLFSLFKVKKLNVIFLEETHSTADDETAWKKERDGEVFLSHESWWSWYLVFERPFTHLLCNWKSLRVVC